MVCNRFIFYKLDSFLGLPTLPLLFGITPLTNFVLVHLKEELSKALQKPIDIIRYRKSMNPYLKKQIEEDAIYV